MENSTCFPRFYGDQGHVMKHNLCKKTSFFFGTFHSGGGDMWFENPILTQFSKK